MAIQSLSQLDNRLAGRPDPTDDEGQMAQQHPLINAISKIPGYAADAATELPGNLWNLASQVPGAAEKIVTHPVDATRDLAGGIARGSQHLASALGEAGQWIGDRATKNIYKSFTGKDLNIPKVNIGEQMGLEGNNQVDLGGMIESNDPNELISTLGRYGTGASSLGKSIPGLISASAMTGAIQANPEDRLEGATKGAVNAALPIGAGKLASKGFNAARPSNVLRGTLSLDELRANLKAAEGTSTGLGDVIGSPTLKRIYENVLPNVPMSGAFTKMQQTANQITGQGEQLMSDIGKNLPEGDKTQILQDALKKASQEAGQDKTANYKRVNDIADQIGLKVNHDKFKSKAKKILKNINSSPDLRRELDSGFVSDIEHYAKDETQRMGSDALASPVAKNLSTSNILKGKLNDKANEHYSNSRNYEYGLMKDLKNALGDDIESSIKDSGNDKLKSAFDTAQKEYGTKYAPFEDPDIVKFTRQGGDADLMLSHFLKGGSNDRGNLLQKLTTKLPEDLRELPLHMYLSKAIDENGKINPPKLDTLYGKLGEKQRSALIPDQAMRHEIENYIKGVGMNKEAFQTMFNPKTGQRNLDSMIGTLEALTGYSIAGLKGALLALPLAGVAGRAANKALTSEKVRTGLVNAMLKAKK